MDLKLEKLQKIITGVAQDNIAAKELIYTYITDNIIPATPDDHCPPLLIIVYAIRNILYPTTAIQLTPDLLDLLAQVDFIRRDAVRQAQDALEKHQFYADRPDEHAPVLDTAERKALEFCRPERSRAQRDLYRTIALSFCSLHIYTLWTSDSSYTIPTRMRMYFPSLYTADSSASSLRLFLHDLSAEEQEETHLVGLSCKQLLTDAYVWDKKRQEYWKEKGLPEDMLYADDEYFSYTRDFRARFPPHVSDERELVATLERYLGKVEGMVATLDRVFQKPQALNKLSSLNGNGNTS